MANRPATEHAEEHAHKTPPQFVSTLWTKGQSGNPGGRPKSLSRYIREQTQDGRELVDFQLAVFRGVVVMPRFAIPEETIKAKDGKPKGKVAKAVKIANERGEGRGPILIPTSVEERQEAATWLADRGWGRPTQMVHLGHESEDGSGLTINILQVLGELPVEALRRLKQVAQDAQEAQAQMAQAQAQAQAQVPKRLTEGDSADGARGKR